MVLEDVRDDIDQGDLHSTDPRLQKIDAHVKVASKVAIDVNDKSRAENQTR
ncbi:hypothetical protein A2U01_0064371, partial [Trifolium medium]|nr:hypothetical protein [Trifolium medium]